MNVVEKLGLLKMDFLGLQTLTVHRRRGRRSSSRAGDSARHREAPARRREDLPLFSMPGAPTGVFQFESGGMTRPAAAGQARPHSRTWPRSTRSTARARMDAGSRATSAARRRAEARRTSLPELLRRSAERPTASWSIRSRSCRSRSASPATRSAEADTAAQRHGQEGRRGHGREREQFVEGAADARHAARRRPHEIFDIHRALRRLRLQQVATPPPTRCSPTRPPISRRTTRWHFMAAHAQLRARHRPTPRQVHRPNAADGDRPSCRRTSTSRGWSSPWSGERSASASAP